MDNNFTEFLLSSADFSNHKKWKWLQEQTLSFIEDRQEFYILLENLSKFKKINSIECKSIIDKINPTDYEAFILALHELTCDPTSNRNGWFIGEKVRVYQFFVEILFHINAPNKYNILIKIVEKCFKKIPLVGPTSRQLGDKILGIFENSRSIEGLGALLKLKQRNKYPIFLERLNLSIKYASNFLKLDPDDIEDYFVADYGIESGILEQSFEDYQSIVKINDYDDVEIIWTKLGNSLKGEPSAVKKDFGNQLKIWKSTISDIKKELSGQRVRIDNFYKRRKSWNYEVWEKHFLNHQLLRFIIRKLIWRFEHDGKIRNGYYSNNQFIDYQGQIISNIENTNVSLWHPSLSSTEEVEAWRNFMLSNEIKQPIKQAFREVYLVTGAEINTSTFSNRFLGHVLRHLKFIALAQQRLWEYSHSNIYSTRVNPWIDYPDFNIKCTFDVDADSDFVTTGPIHFRDTKHNVALRMEAIPTLLFSESMRDVDLFVGVCSIGAEEQWENQRFREYWIGYSTSDLSETAQTRRSVIESLVSKLKIKDRCEVTNRYLKVTGKKRIYKIHFGSGNIMMEPNDQYLCIIPDPRPIKDRLFLPFDGDNMLSIIISKALLLADDDKIKDPIILNQINR